MTDRPLVTITSTAPSPEADRLTYDRALIRPRHTPARTGPSYQRTLVPSEVLTVLADAAGSQYLAVDFETKGADYSQGHIYMAGIGLAWDTGSCYMQWSELGPSERSAVKQLLTTHQGLLAHNSYFDGGVLRVNFGSHGHFAACTQALLKFLSNEGWAGQKYGLKEAMTEILLWSSDNTEGTDIWLVEHGFYKGNRLKDESPENLRARALAGSLKADKAELWRVPKDILAPYCILDAEAAYLLYTQILRPVAERFPELLSFFEKEWMYLIQIHIDQHVHGILMDTEGLARRREELEGEITVLTEKFLTHPEVAPAVLVLEQEYLLPLAAKEPPRFKKAKPRPAEPARLTKKGEPNKAYLKWVAMEAAGKYLPQQSLNWENWKERYDLAASGENPDYRFNIDSGQQKAELLYRRLGYEIQVLTESEGPSTAGKAVMHMGEIGKILVAREDLMKELTYITKYQELTQEIPTIHPKFSLPGTSTGRLSSSQINLQQVKKTKAMMNLFVSRPGTTWIDLDFSALEPVVTAEFTGDENLLKLYGNGRPANDVYLFIGSGIPGIGEKIRAAGYNPDAPTKEGVASAKKICKHERNLCKVVHLSAGYGAGARKIYETLQEQGAEVTFEEIELVYRGYWELFSTVKQYGYDLEKQWWDNLDVEPALKEQYQYWSRSKANRDRVPKTLASYILNGFGRPMSVNAVNKKDLLNRFIQGTGHDVLARYIYILTHALTDAGIPWSPAVLDWHDSCAVEVPDEYTESTIQIFRESMDVLNLQLGGSITLKGEPSWGKTLTSIKEPEA